MTDWVASDIWGGWIADLGPYTGPAWPAPPIPANVPAAAGEIDYVIGYPDADPANFAPAAPYWVGWRNSGGASHSSTGYTGAVSGMHIAVVWYAPGSPPPGTYPAPTVTPESLAPPSFADTGTGSPVGDPTVGAWSDPMTLGFVTTWPGVANTGIHVTSSGPDQGAAVTDVITATTGSVVTVSPGAGFDVALASDGTFTADLDQLVIPAVNPPAPDKPPPDLIEGLDYWMLPGATDTDTYRYLSYVGAPGAAFAGDTPVSVPVSLAGVFGVDPHGSNTYAYETISFDAVQGAYDPTGSTTPVIDDTDGTVVWSGSITATAADNIVDNTITFTPTSDAPALLLRPHNKAGLSAPISGWSSPGADTSITWSGHLTAAAADVNAVTGSFRLWVPSTGPVLRTVGDHFDTPPGTTVRMLQPSGRWLPIRKHA